MKKYLVIGNPIDHSLSPQLHNYWIKKNNINAVYDKQKLNSDGLKDLISKVKSKEISGINVTVPFKREIIFHLNKLTSDAKATQSVNTILLVNDKITGHNTDIEGFENAINDTNYNVNGKKILILGAGGVVPSIIFALYKMKVSSVVLSNRTKKKAEILKNQFNKVTVIDWGEIPDFDMVINATSVGLKNEDQLNLNFSSFHKNKFFYDLIYNPIETNFLKGARELGNKTENGKKMFIYQAAQSFKIWHEIDPTIDNDVIKLLDK